MFAENLKKIRKDKGYTQEILAEKLNVVRQTVSKWEKGLSLPDVDMLSKIANVLKKYLKINISSKSITTAIDVILDISGTIDELTYNFVDYICDTFRIRCPEKNKKIIARALRLIMPI